MKWFWCAVLLIWLAGCGAHLPQTELSLKGNKHPCRVAVLPFANETGDFRVGRLIYRVFLSQLIASHEFQVVEEGRIRNFLRLERCLVGKEPPPRVLRTMGERLGVEAIIGGTVLEAKEDRQGVFLSLSIWVRDAKEGQLLWSTYHSRRGDDYQKIFHFGRILTLTRLSEKMVQEILADWQKKNLGGCQQR